MLRNLKIVVLVTALAVFNACSQQVRQADGQSGNGANASNPAAKTGGVNVPGNMKNAYRDSELAKESAAVVTLPNNTDVLYRKDAQKLSMDDLGKKFDEYRNAAGGGSKDAKAVYIIAEAGNEYASVIKIFELMRRMRIETARLVVSQNEKGEPTDIFNVLLSKEPRDDVPVKPNPNFLAASMPKDGIYLLNSEGGTLDTLKSKLKEVFKYREDNLVLREGTNEVDKTVNIKAPPSAKYEDVVRLIDAVRETGANPIVIQIEDESGIEKITLK
jgi:biopolymer transport protein ExbD